MFILLAACATGTPAAPSATPGAAQAQRGLAVVQSITIDAPEAQRPAQVTARGQLPDACTSLAESTVQRTEQVFVVNLATLRSGEACAAVVSDFERTVALETDGLPAGDYVVVVNGVSGVLVIGGAVAALQPTPTALPPASPAPAATSAPTLAPTGAAQPTPAPSPTAVSSPVPTSAANCINKAAFYADVTVPDNTAFKQGTTFVKTWRVRNVGTCAWEGYTLVFAGGQQMNGAQSSPLPATAPDAIVDISITLTAPSRGGSHVGNWQFESKSGERFGVGAERTGALWVAIVVDYGGQAGGGPGSGGSGGSGGAAGGSCATRDGSFESRVLALINSARAANGLPALTAQGQLTEAAWQHSRDMACNDFINHTGSDGSTWYDRVSRQGYANYNTARENIYVGSPAFGGTPQGAFDWWMNSQVHRENILNPTVTEIGVAYAFNANSTYGGYYTVVFARPWNP